MEKARQEIPISDADTIEMQYAGMCGEDNKAIAWYISGDEYQAHYYLPMEIEIKDNGANYTFVQTYKPMTDRCAVETILSRSDDELRLSTPNEEGRSDCWKAFSIDHYISDGDTIDCGDKQIKVIATPGHTPGCMSYVFPVLDNGEEHTACLFGGATPPWGDVAGKEIQKQSVIKFIKVVKENHADVALVNHAPFGTRRTSRCIHSDLWVLRRCPG